MSRSETHADIWFKFCKNIFWQFKVTSVSSISTVYCVQTCVCVCVFFFQIWLSGLTLSQLFCTRANKSKSAVYDPETEPFIPSLSFCKKSFSGSASECRSNGREFEPQPGPITFVEIDNEIQGDHFSKNIVPGCSKNRSQMSQLMRLWYLSHRRPAKAQASLRIRAVSPEPSLFAHMNYGSRRRVTPTIRYLAPVDGRACPFEEWIYGGRKVS